MPTMPPFEAEYAAWPICPSKAATEARFTIAPRAPSPSTGSVLDIAEAARRRTLKEPIRFTRITNSKVLRSKGVPSRPTVRDALPIPAALTSERSGPSSVAASTAAWTCASSATSALANLPLIDFATASPFSSLRSTSTQRAPSAASRRAEASPMPEAPPVTNAEVPLSSMARMLDARGRRRERPGKSRPCPQVADFERVSVDRAGPPPSLARPSGPRVPGRSTGHRPIPLAPRPSARG